MHAISLLGGWIEAAPAHAPPFEPIGVRTIASGLGRPWTLHGSSGFPSKPGGRGSRPWSRPPVALPIPELLSPADLPCPACFLRTQAARQPSPAIALVACSPARVSPPRALPQADTMPSASKPKEEQQQEPRVAVVEASSLDHDVEAAALSATDSPSSSGLGKSFQSPSSKLTAHQAFYLFGLDGVGAFVISGGINFAIAYGKSRGPRFSRLKYAPPFQNHPLPPAHTGRLL